MNPQFVISGVIVLPVIFSLLVGAAWMEAQVAEGIERTAHEEKSNAYHQK